MAPPALPAKLARPRLHSPLARERLFQRLDRAREGASVIWVDGPPGCGKTTSVATWLEARKLPGHWYHADQSDADPATLFVYLSDFAASVRKRATRLPYLTPQYLADLPGFTHRFFRDFLGRLGRDAVVVLDNVHEAASESFHSVLREAGREFGASATLICISREAPPPAFARFATNGELARIVWDDLRFRPEESEAFVVARTGDGANAAALHERSSGWAAGLVLLLGQEQPPTEADAAGIAGGATVFDYFAGEIFEHARPEARDVMLRTALLPQVTRDMAIAVSGRVDAPAWLEELFRRQYFTQRSAGPIPAYRYHDLFREFLLARLEHHVGPAELETLRRHAAALLTEAGSYSDAAELYRRAEDWEAVAELVRMHAGTLFEAGRWQSVAAWLAGMPDAVIHRDPWTLFWWASCRAMTDPKTAQAALTEAFEAFAANGDEAGEFAAALAQAEVVFVLGESFLPLNRWIDALTPLLARERAFESVSMGVRAWTAFVHACLYVRPGHPLIVPGVRYLDASARDAALNDTQRAGAITVMLGYAHFAADDTLRERWMPVAEKLVESENVAPVTRVWTGIWVHVTWFMMSDWRRSLDWSQRVKALAQRFNLQAMGFVAEIYRSLSLCHLGDRAAALRIDEQLIAQAGENKFYNLAYAQSNAARIWMYEERSDLALATIRTAVRGAQHTGFLFTEAVWGAYEAAILADLGRFDEAAECIRRSYRFTEGTIARFHEGFFAAVDAWVHLARGDRDGAVRCLRTCLEAAAQWKRAALIVWVQHRLPQLFSLALEENIEPARVRELIRLWRVPAPPSREASWPWQVKIRALGGFEVWLDGEPLTVGRKAPKRLLELLKAIVALGGRDVPMHRLADALFPDKDADVAQDTLRVSLQRLRKLLGGEIHVPLREGRVSLDPATVWVDAVVLQQAFAENDTAAASALDLYRGPLLPDEEATWAIAPRDKLVAAFLRHAGRRAQASEVGGQWIDAFHWYDRCAEVDPLNEGYCQGILRCSLALGRVAEGESAAQRTELAIARAFRRPLSETTQRLWKELRSS